VDEETQTTTNPPEENPDLFWNTPLQGEKDGWDRTLKYCKSFPTPSGAYIYGIPFVEDVGGAKDIGGTNDVNDVKELIIVRSVLDMIINEVVSEVEDFGLCANYISER